jgi:hypothetical protein
MGPLLGAMAFASVMAFEGGTDRVPGSGRGDIVPALLEPGEGVVPGGVMDKLSAMARSGSMDSGGSTHVHVHYSPTNHVHAIDGASVKGMLNTHRDEFATHFRNEVRKMNKR